MTTINNLLFGNSLSDIIQQYIVTADKCVLFGEHEKTYHNRFVIYKTVYVYLVKSIIFNL